MKRILSLISILCLNFICIFKIQADADTNIGEGQYTVPLYEESVEPPQKDPIPPKGNRSPKRPITCLINKQYGITLYGADVENIVSLEIHNLNTGFTCSFNDQWDFISTLYSMNGEVIIKLSTSESSYTGSLCLTN